MKSNRGNENYNYNIEDTGRLMTMSAGDRKKKTVILAVIAVVAVAAIAFLGIKMLNDSKYDKQVAIAEKALREGNYEQAETAYLEAVDMNKRKTKAREGLAYTYALESKFSESKEVYYDLYTETKDEKYREASNYVDNEILPFVEGITPEDLWISISPDRMPGSYGAEEFLGEYVTWYYLFGFFDESGDPINDYRYDNEDPGDSYVMTFAHTYLEPEATEFVYEEDDPRGWSSGIYEIEDQVAVDEVMTEVFHADSEALEGAVDKLDERGMMYLEDGSYYQFFPATGGPVINATISNVWLNGSRFCVEYDAVGDEVGPETIQGDPHVGTFYAVIDLSGIDSSYGWAMYYNGTEMPDYIAETLAVPDDETEEEDEGAAGDNEVFSQLEGVSFGFSSGAGGWGTELTVNPDGTFEGEYHDSDMGDTGSGYPDGTVHICSFTGQFSAPEKVDDHTYRFKVTSLEYDDPGSESIEDGIRYITEEPYGVINGDTVELYTPGKSGEDLPEAFKEWIIRVADESEYDPEMTTYGLLIGECGFRGWSE